MQRRLADARVKHTCSSNRMLENILKVHPRTVRSIDALVMRPCSVKKVNADMHSLTLRCIQGRYVATIVFRERFCETLQLDVRHSRLIKQRLATHPSFVAKNQSPALPKGGGARSLHTREQAALVPRAGCLPIKANHILAHLEKCPRSSVVESLGAAATAVRPTLSPRC